MAHIFDTGEHAAVSDERTTLETFLDFYRDVVVNKVRGLSDEDAQRQLVSSATTLASLLKHLRRVEVSWFQYRLAQRPAADLAPMAWIEAGAQDDFHIEPHETVDRLIEAYREECQRSRDTAAHYALDRVVPHPVLGQVSLRWIYVHMIDETARHAGHADILREQIDGTVGD